mgnify:CR=1 FL=1
MHFGFKQCINVVNILQYEFIAFQSFLLVNIPKNVLQCITNNNLSYKKENGNTK